MLRAITIDNNTEKMLGPSNVQKFRDKIKYDAYHKDRTENNYMGSNR